MVEKNPTAAIALDINSGGIGSMAVGVFFGPVLIEFNRVSGDANIGIPAGLG